MTVDAAVRPPARAAARLRRLAAQTGMELRLTLRNGESLLVTFGIPLVLLVFFSLVDVLPIDGSAVEYLVPGVLALSVMSTAMVALGIATGFERSYLVLKRLGASPLRRSELVGAKVLTVVAVEVVQVTLVLGVAVLGLGYRAPGAAAGLAIVAIALGTAAFAGIGLAAAGRLRAVATLALLNAAYLALLLVSGIAFPLDRLPSALQVVAGLLPSTALADLLRAAFSGATGDVVGDLVVLAVWAIAAVTLAVRVFRWE